MRKRESPTTDHERLHQDNAAVDRLPPDAVAGCPGIDLQPARRDSASAALDMPRWCLPSGSVELEETALDALKREVAEETSLVVLDAEADGAIFRPTQKFAYLNGDEIQCFSIAFVVRKWQGEPRADGIEGSERPLLCDVAIAQRVGSDPQAHD